MVRDTEFCKLSSDVFTYIMTCVHVYMHTYRESKERRKKGRRIKERKGGSEEGRKKERWAKKKKKLLNNDMMALQLRTLAASRRPAFPVTAWQLIINSKGIRCSLLASKGTRYACGTLSAVVLLLL